jgi:Tol biopolymer transport system component/predicted Ser/Thr protein kinase
MPLQQGSMAGPYEILSTLGSGGMGTVYLARDRRLDRRVALKVLHDTPDALAHGQLLHEARAASALNHPHICHVYDVGEHDGMPWIAMEYVEGQPLNAAIQAGRLDPDEALRIAIQIADGLAHAHERGIVHRDLKSANVVCDREGRARILDFGLAAHLPRAVAEQVTRSQSLVEPGGIAGTLPYIAPEVLKGAPAGERSDLWSLGVVLHEMLSGSRPFDGDTTIGLASAIIEQPPRPLPASVPPGVAAAVSRLLAKNPADRYHSASETRAAFEALRAGPRAGDRPARRGNGWWIAAAAAAGAAIAWAAWTWIAPPSGLTLSQQRLVSVSGRSERSPALSPDGSQLAFVAADARGVPQIWMRNLARENAVQITAGDRSASRPRWSPSGDRIVYVAGGGIWSVPPLGGEPTRLMESGAEPNFSRDGSRLVFERDRKIWTAAADGSGARAVPGVPSKYYNVPSGPAFSPDGRSIAYFHPERGPNGDLWVVPAEGGPPRRLTQDLREGGWPVWTADGQWIVFSSARAGSRTLWQVPVDGGSPLPLTTGAGADDEPDLGADGRHLVYSNVRHTWELRIRDLADGQERALLERRGELLFPLFSPDGRHLTFFGRADYAVAIWTMAADGSGLRQLTGGRELNHQPRWGADGSEIYFYQVAPGISFRRIPAVGGASTAFRDWEWQVQNSPFFSPDGRFIAYTRQRPLDAPPDTPEALVVHEVATGQERELPGEHSHMGRWSPDGRELVVWRHDGNVWRCEVESGGCTMVTQGTAPVWSGDARRIYVMRVPRGWDQGSEVWSVDRDGGEARFEALLGNFRPTDRYFDVSREGLLAWAPWRAGEHEVWTATVR